MNTSNLLVENNLDGRRVALYLRSACVSQADLGAALDLQRCALHGVVARHRLQLAAEYSDAPASGLDSARPGLYRMLEDAKAQCRPFDIVLVKSSSRLSRQMDEVVDIAWELAKQGIQLFSIDEGHVSVVAFSSPGRKSI